MYRTSRREYRERLSNSSILSRSGAHSSLNRSHILDVETRLKDMNKKILEAMAESRRTVVRLLTEPMDSCDSLSFEAKLKEVQDEKKQLQLLGTPLIETKSKLLSIKTLETSGSKVNPLSSRQGTKREEESREEEKQPFLSESISQIEPKMSEKMGSSAFILNSLNSGLSEGQHTSNFTGLLKDMQDTETDVLLGSKPIGIQRIQSSKVMSL